MNWQFFATAGICSGISIFVAIVFLILWAIGEECYWYYVTANTMEIISMSLFILPVVFWFVIGVICGLSEIWNWGLVQC